MRGEHYGEGNQNFMKEIVEWMMPRCCTRCLQTFSIFFVSFTRRVINDGIINAHTFASGK